MDVGGEAVGRVVGDLDCLFLIPVTDDRHHRSENLLAGDGHGIGRVGEHRRANIIATGEPVGSAGTAGNEGRAFGDSGFDKMLDLVPLDL